VAGAIGSLIAPWVNWGIEKRKLRLAARRDFIASARLELDADLDKHKFREGVLYSRLSPFLSENTRREIESDATTVQTGGRCAGVNNYFPLTLDDLHVLEQTWKLL